MTHTICVIIVSFQWHLSNKYTHTNVVHITHTFVIVHQSSVAKIDANDLTSSSAVFFKQPSIFIVAVLNIGEEFS